MLQTLVKSMEKDEAQARRKKEIRREALQRRDNLTKEQRRECGGKILEKLTALCCYREADALLTYVSFRSEVDTFALIRLALEEGKAVFTPKVLGRDMVFFRIFSIDDLREGYQGILEPSETISYTDWVSQFEREQEKTGKCRGHSPGRPQVLVCMPGTAFDRNRHRIGYGGGFYDRCLPGLEAGPAKKITTAALAFSCQVFEEIPWEPHDIRPAYLLTEKEILP